METFGSRRLASPIPVSERAPTRAAAVAVLAAAVSLAMLSGCETWDGKLYWAGHAPGFRLETSCTSADVANSPSVRVEATIEKKGPLQGALVRFGRRPGAQLAFVTTADGIVEASLGPGVWEIDVRRTGVRPAHARFELPEGQACTLKFRLWVDESVYVTGF